MIVELVPALPRHVNRVAKNMRPIDVLECQVMGHTPKEALRTGLLGAVMAWTVMIDGEPEGMCGVTPLNMSDGRGRPWLLMTVKGGQLNKSLVRFGRIYTEQMHRYFPQLENWVHDSNHKTIRWLTRLGYAIGSVDVIRGQKMRPFVRQQ